MKKFDVAGFLPVTLLDYPGSVASTVFTYGCNLRCRYCHNPELVIGVLPESKLTEFENYISEKNIEAVAVTGGEPMMLPDLEIFLHELKNKGLKVKLDTNGMFPTRLESIFNEKLVDYLAVDLKGFSDIDYQYITRTEAKLHNFVRTVKLAQNHDVPFEVRYTAWRLPADEEVFNLFELIGDVKIIVQQLNSDGKMLDKRFGNMFKKVNSSQLSSILCKYFSNVVIREAAYS